ncbi:MAG: Uma2 family endonuclease [Myxococcota bacterium]
MTAAAASAPSHMTEADYLVMERAASTKHELWDGEVFAMTGGTLAHAKLIARMITQLSNALGDRDCEVYSSEAKVRIPSSRGFVYPDVSVVCGPVQTYQDSDDILLNPILVIEVLSPSTERFDRSDKFGGYRSLPSLVDYGLVAQDFAQVELYTRQPDGSWTLRIYDDAHPRVVLPSVEVQVSLTELYRGM